MINRRKPLLVQKYGGSSLSSLDHVRAVARKVIASRNAGQATRPHASWTCCSPPASA